MYTKQAIENILHKVSKKKISPQKAYEKLKYLSYETLQFAKIDHHRPLRKNLPEVIYAPGKTISQLKKIVTALNQKGNPILITRLEENRFRKLKKSFPKLNYSKLGRVAYITSGLTSQFSGRPENSRIKRQFSNSLPGSSQNGNIDPNKNQIIENAYKMVIEKYDWQKITLQMKSIFDNL